GFDVFARPYACRRLQPVVAGRVEAMEHRSARRAGADHIVARAAALEAVEQIELRATLSAALVGDDRRQPADCQRHGGRARQTRCKPPRATPTGGSLSRHSCLDPPLPPQPHALTLRTSVCASLTWGIPSDTGSYFLTQARSMHENPVS